jgi:O-antigen/teichoic acid export membrane protein
MLVSGTALAQIINIAFYPLITRLYGPESFGSLGYFSALLSFIVPFSTLCYPLALVLPKKETQVRLLVDISFKLSILVFFIVAVSIFIIDYFYPEIIPFKRSYYFVSIGVFFSSMVMIYSQLAIRRRQYKLISLLAVIIAVLGGVLKVGVGYFFATDIALITISIFLLIINFLCLFFILKMKINFLELIYLKKKHLALAYRYIRFPLFRMPHAVLAVTSQIAPVFLLTFYFGAIYAGYFVLTRTILSAPVALMGKAVYDVSYPRINDNYNKGLCNYDFILKTTMILSVISLVPLVFMFVFGEFFFMKIFGDEWIVSGTYAAWMCMWFAFNFFNKAVTAAVSVYSLDGFLFRNGVVNNFLSLTGFLVGALYFNSDIIAIALFSCLSVFSQVNLIFRVLHVVKKNESQIS